MADRPASWIPIISGLCDFAVVAALMLLWYPQPHTFWWFVRAIPVLLFFYMGCMSMWHAFVISDGSLRRRLNGDYND